MCNKYRVMAIALIYGLTAGHGVLAADSTALSQSATVATQSKLKSISKSDPKLIGTWDAYADIDANIAGGTYKFKSNSAVELIPDIKGAKPAKGYYTADQGVLTVNLSKEGMGTSSMFYTIHTTKKGSPELLELHYTNGIKQSFQKRAITKGSK